MATNNEHTSGQEEFSKLIGDLRAMPRVSAPSNFEFLLQQKILATEKIREPWWKRFFLGTFDLGGFHIPAYAFTGATAVVVAVVSVLVVNNTDFQSQLDRVAVESPAPELLKQDQTVTEQQQPPQEPASSAIAADEGRDNEKRDRDAFRETAPAATQQSNALGRTNQPAIIPAPLAPLKPKDIPSGMAAPSTTTQSRNEEDLMPKTRGMVEEESEQIQDKKAGAADSEMKLDDRQKDNIEVRAAEKSGTELKKESGRDSNKYKMMLLEGNHLVAKQASIDSTKIRDSLRRVDSLRSLKTK